MGSINWHINVTTIVGISQANPSLASGIKLKSIIGIKIRILNINDVYTPIRTAFILFKYLFNRLVTINVIATGYNIFSIGPDNDTILSIPSCPISTLIIDN